MLIDHVNKALIYPNLNGGILLVISDIFDILGRIAFPIFIFLLIEGYFRTTNRWKYLGMLLLFGIISEIPYDMFTTASYFEPNGNNIMFTLALVLVIIWIIDTLKEKIGVRWRILWYFISAVIAVSYTHLQMVFSVRLSSATTRFVVRGSRLRSIHSTEA